MEEPPWRVALPGCLPDAGRTAAPALSLLPAVACCCRRRAEALLVRDPVVPALGGPGTQRSAPEEAGDACDGAAASRCLDRRRLGARAGLGAAQPAPASLPGRKRRAAAHSARSPLPPGRAPRVPPTPRLHPGGPHIPRPSHRAARAWDDVGTVQRRGHGGRWWRDRLLAVLPRVRGLCPTAPQPPDTGAPRSASHGQPGSAGAGRAGAPAVPRAARFRHHSPSCGLAPSRRRWRACGAAWCRARWRGAAFRRCWHGTHRGTGAEEAHRKPPVT